MEKRGKFTITSIEEVLEKHIGAIGTPERTAFDKEIEDALYKYNEETRAAIEEARRGESVGTLDMSSFESFMRDVNALD